MREGERVIERERYKGKDSRRERDKGKESSRERNRKLPKCDGRQLFKESVQ